ncbi:MAG: hypothetical protein KDJ51_03705, partial [Nitratireductor sp.]|nr:hypothetical protein [Nitratireductor sp.]
MFPDRALLLISAPQPTETDQSSAAIASTTLDRTRSSRLHWQDQRKEEIQDPVSSVLSQPDRSEMVEFSKLIKFLNVEKHGLYDSNSRRTRIFNLIVILAVLNLTLVALPQYIFLGLEKHIYLISWSGIVGILWLLTPLFHRINSDVAFFYFIFTAWFGFVVQGYITGSSLGSHYYLLMSPLSILYFSSRRWIIAFLCT